MIERVPIEQPEHVGTSGWAEHHDVTMMPALAPTETVEATRARQARHVSVSPEQALAVLRAMHEGALRR